MHSIAICDDQGEAIDALAALIGEWAAESDEQVAIKRYADAPGLISDMESSRFDAVFLDIHLGAGGDGMSAAGEIRARDENMPIIFVTSYMDYALKGYEVRAFRYLMKPVSRREVFACLCAVATHIHDRIEREYSFKTADGERRMPHGDILYFEIFSHTVELHSASGQVYRHAARISELERRLPPCFVRCHRSIIVNMHHVFAIKKNSVELDTTAELPVSQRRRADVQRAFLRYRV